LGGLNFVTVSAGFNHTCGVTNGNAAYCWGYNNHGEVGDGTTSQRTRPVAVVGGLTFTTISAGNVFTCGMTTTGDAYCWGDNGSGELGDGTTTASLVPVRVL